MSGSVSKRKRKKEKGKKQTRFKVHVKLKAPPLYGANDVVVKVVWWERARMGMTTSA